MHGLWPVVSEIHVHLGFVGQNKAIMLVVVVLVGLAGKSVAELYAHDDFRTDDRGNWHSFISAIDLSPLQFTTRSRAECHTFPYV